MKKGDTMKYIRTKDKIYEPTKWQCDLTGEMILVKADNKFGNDGVFARDIIKQADTIEELLDELVVHNPSNDGDFYPKHFVYRNKWETMLNPMSDYQKSKGIEVYGAIWTDKGLIYVAKMNDKGELELL